PETDAHGATLISAADGSATLTEDSGDFTVELPLGTTTLTASRAGFSALPLAVPPFARGETVELAPGTLTPLEHKGTTLRGRVAIAGQLDASGVTVSIVALGLTTTTSADGTFELADVPLGNYDLAIEKGELSETILSVFVGFDLNKVAEDAFEDLGLIEL